MAASPIVEGFDVVGHIGACEVSVLVDLLLDALFLEAAEERLGDGVVPAISLSAHAGFQVMGAAETTPGVATKLSALVRMDDRAARSPAPHGDEHRIQYEFALQGGPDRPADNPT